MKKLALIFFTALGFVQVASASFTVTNTNDSGAGSLRQAVLDANSNPGTDVIVFDSTVFSTPRTINLTTGELVISDSVTIQGPGANLLTVQRDFNAATNFRVFNIQSRGLTVSISGMTISNGNAVGTSGGGINCQSNLTLTNVHVTGNQASIGGGVALDFADGTFASCTFSGNIAGTQGGGIEFESDGGRTLGLTNSTVSGNTANGSGAGGGIFHGSGSGHGFLAAFNCTIANNSGANGGGIHTVAGGSAANQAATLLNNTIIANNTPTNLVKATFSGATAAVGSQGFNLSDNYNGAVTLVSTDLTGQPLLGALSFNGGTTPTHALLGGSPALDKGNGSGIDQRGLARGFNITTISPANGGNDSDIGAVEMQALIVNSTADPGDGVCDATCTLRDAITAANANGPGLNDVIFDNTVFNTARTITLSNVLPDIASSLTINGPGANLLTVRRDPNAATFRIFNVADGITSGVALTGMTIVGGNAGPGTFGGGIFSRSNLALTGVHVTGNTAATGGGVHQGSADGVFTNCTFSNNASTNAQGDGGGVFFQGDGGHTLRLVSSTVSGNHSANHNGGGISTGAVSGNSRLEIINSTITNNTANITGGGIFTFTIGPGTTATTTLRNTIIAGNTPNNLATGTFSGGGAATVTTYGFNLASDNGGGFLNVAPITTDKINTPAGLGALGANGGTTPTHALLFGSAALDAGNNSGSGVLVDQRGAGFLRTVDLAAANAPGSDGTDIGAFEAQSAPPAALVANVSTRLPVGTGDNALIEGFIVTGPSGSTKKIIVRAIGPSLIPFGIADAVANPTLEIFDANNAKIASNDNWKTTQVGGIIASDQFVEINSSGVAPSNDLESAIIANLAPGSYTAAVRGAGNTVGTGVVDAFDLSSGSTARLANIATRGLIQAGDKLMIAGFIIQGGSVKTVIRAIGPSLAAFGIADALPDTTLQLRDQNGAIVRENDDWMSDQKTELENIGLQPSHNLEAALVQTIPAGLYTAQVRGKPETTGTGVVQIYFLQ